MTEQEWLTCNRPLAMLEFLWNRGELPKRKLVPPGRYQFQRPQELTWFLLALAKNKVVEAVRHLLMTQKFNVNRERGLNVGRHASALKARQPAPAEIAIAREEWKLLVKGQPEHYQKNLAGLLDGCTQQEIAVELRINAGTVRRVVRKLSPALAAVVQVVVTFYCDIDLRRQLEKYWQWP
jgi:DNA-directed RNA polymerase specialized sigma24 family protein